MYIQSTSHSYLGPALDALVGEATKAMSSRNPKEMEEAYKKILDKKNTMGQNKSGLKRINGALVDLHMGLSRQRHVAAVP